MGSHIMKLKREKPSHFSRVYTMLLRLKGWRSWECVQLNLYIHARDMQTVKII